MALFFPEHWPFISLYICCCRLPAQLSAYSILRCCCSSRRQVCCTPAGTAWFDFPPTQLRTLAGWATVEPVEECGSSTLFVRVCSIRGSGYGAGCPVLHPKVAAPEACLAAAAAAATCLAGSFSWDAPSYKAAQPSRLHCGVAVHVLYHALCPVKSFSPGASQDAAGSPSSITCCGRYHVQELHVACSVSHDALVCNRHAPMNAQESDTRRTNTR